MSRSEWCLYFRWLLRNSPDTSGDILANLVNRHVQRVFGVVAVDASVDIEVGSLRVTGPVGCRAHGKENGWTLVDPYG